MMPGFPNGTIVYFNKEPLLPSWSCGESEPQRLLRGLAVCLGQVVVYWDMPIFLFCEAADFVVLQDFIKCR